MKFSSGRILHLVDRVSVSSFLQKLNGQKAVADRPVMLATHLVISEKSIFDRWRHRLYTRPRVFVLDRD